MALGRLRAGAAGRLAAACRHIVDIGGPSKELGTEPDSQGID